MLLIIFSCTKETNEPNDNSDPDIGSEIQGEIYFPQNNSNTWETESITTLKILHNGKIVVESYLNNHTATTPWYWASAGKTLTTAMSGIAQEAGFININNKVSDYIGTNWTNISLEKENLITCKNLLSMNSGLDDTNDSVSPEDLSYTADAGTRWAYHNVYKKMQDVIAEATNITWDTYFNTELKDKIGMSGAWNETGNYNLFWSNTRSMARFGLLIFNHGKWEENQIIPEDFLTEATTTSQDINLSYGYLWWLNGKSSYHLPSSQVEFDGSLIPNAPDDMIAALGANDQKIYIVPSENLVIVRMGQAADEENFALSNFDNELWTKINSLID